MRSGLAAGLSCAGMSEGELFLPLLAAALGSMIPAIHLAANSRVGLGSVDVDGLAWRT